MCLTCAFTNAKLWRFTELYKLLHTHVMRSFSEWWKEHFYVTLNKRVVISPIENDWCLVNKGLGYCKRSEDAYLALTKQNDDFCNVLEFMIKDFDMQL